MKMKKKENENVANPIKMYLEIKPQEVVIAEMFPQEEVNSLVFN